MSGRKSAAILALALLARGTVHAEPLGPSPAELEVELLVRQALASAPALARAAAEVERAQSSARRARSALFPRLSLTEEWSSTDRPIAAFGSLLEQGRLAPERLAAIGEPERIQNFVASAKASAVLFDAGRAWSLWSAADEDAARLRRIEQLAQRRVRFDVAAAYYGLQRARAEVGVWSDTLRALESRRSVAAERFAAGEVLRSDVSTIDVRLSEAREAAISATQGALLARAELAAAVGVPFESLDPAHADLGKPVYELAVEDVVARALAGHPTLAALERARRAAEAFHRAAVAARLPSVVGEVAGHWNGDDEELGFERDSVTAGVRLELPLFEGGRLAAEQAEAAARRREVDAAIREARLAIELDARRADRQAREATARIAVADAGVIAAGEVVTILAERYAAGLVPIETMLEAERDRTGAHARAVAARSGARIAIEAVRLVAGESEQP